MLLECVDGRKSQVCMPRIPTSMLRLLNALFMSFAFIADLFEFRAILPANWNQTEESNHVVIPTSSNR